ncbi:hypothetical protein SESBI_22201 [Sesbania bispinosa]|nr:hypothetical protein SESBI_22201 [Sesbania bispinosa]
MYENIAGGDMVHRCIKNIKDGSRIFLSLGGMTTCADIADENENARREEKTTQTSHIRIRLPEHKTRTGSLLSSPINTAAPSDRRAVAFVHRRCAATSLSSSMCRCRFASHGAALGEFGPPRNMFVNICSDFSIDVNQMQNRENSVSTNLLAMVAAHNDKFDGEDCLLDSMMYDRSLHITVRSSGEASLKNGHPNDDKSEKILEVDTWKPHFKSHHSSSFFQTAHYYMKLVYAWKCDNQFGAMTTIDKFFFHCKYCCAASCDP